MKQLFNHIKLSGATFGIIFALILVALPVFAGPAGAPPAGNVDASFNSVTAGGGAVGGSFTGLNYGVSGQGRNKAGGRFESLTTPGNVVELGSADFAMEAKGAVDVVGSVKVKQTFPAPYAATFQGSLGGTPPEVTIADSSNAISTKGNILVQSGDINVPDGKIRAKSIGRFYTNKGADTVVGASAYTSVYAGCDSFGHKRISCGFTSTGSDTVQSDTGTSGADFSCSLYVKNLSTTSSSTVSALATCFDPNG